jgi:X-X-X-Leu-X-X-Gly heptad repeat protein
VIDSDTARAGAKSAWMKDWGQFVMLLLALGGFYGFIRSDMSAMEGRLGDRIDRNTEAISQVRGEVAQVRGEATQLREGLAQVRGGVTQLREGLAQVREEVAQVREDVAHLEGYIRGRLGDDPG